jgi:hypothetical protein
MGIGIDTDEVSLSVARINSIAAAESAHADETIKSREAPAEYPCEWYACTCMSICLSI